MALFLSNNGTASECKRILNFIGYVFKLIDCGVDANKIVNIVESSRIVSFAHYDVVGFLKAEIAQHVGMDIQFDRFIEEYSAIDLLKPVQTPCRDEIKQLLFNEAPNQINMH